MAIDESSKAEAIAEKDLVRRALSFANTGRPEGLPGARVLTQGAQTFLVLTEELGAQQADLRRDLMAIVAGELSGPAVARLRKQARHVVVRSYVMERGALLPRERHFVPDLETLLADVLLRIRSDEVLRGDVRQCRLARCGRFFLVSDTVADPSQKGRRRHRYCGPEHMDEAQTPGAKRTAEYRKRLKARAERLKRQK